MLEAMKTIILPIVTLFVFTALAQAADPLPNHALQRTRLGLAKDPKYPKAKVSFEDFKGLVAKVEKQRASRLIDLNTFLKMSKEEGVIILDSRSDFRFDRIHLKGAKHLAFTDYTQDNLAKVIPNPDTKILIYCNNNFDGNQVDFASKARRLPPQPAGPVGAQMAVQEKPLTLALNIPTYINLYGYGYRNVYELNELVHVSDPRITFEGTIADQKPAPPALPFLK
jgi:rhodanese-related sulfurtransferase